MLEVSNVTKTFGGLTALDKVSFEVGNGEIVGLIGPNGAGKTTLFNTISGIYTPEDGDIAFMGDRISGSRPSDICHAGIVRTFQIVRTFDESTVFENVLAGAMFGSGDRISEEDAIDRAEAAIEFVDLTAVRDTKTHNLPIAQRKQVELARGLACEPDLLMIDEMGAGLTPAELDELVSIIGRIRAERGISVLWIEHVMRAILEVSDRVLVLHQGELIASGSPEEIKNDDQVIDAYLGDTI